MVAAFKILALPSLFILPWLWMKIANEETFVRELLSRQPLVAGAVLLPGLIVSIVWIVKQLQR